MKCMQIGSLVEKACPSNSFSKGVLLGRCLAEQTGQLSPTILLWALLRFAAAVDQDPAMSLRTLPARFAPMQSAAQAEWLSLDYSVELTGQTHSLPSPNERTGCFFFRNEFQDGFSSENSSVKGPTLVLGDANPLYVLHCITCIQIYHELWWYVIVLSLQWLSTDSSHTYSWQRFGTFVRTLGHRPLEYSKSLHIKGPKLCQVLFEILHPIEFMTPIDTLSKRRPSLCGFSKQVYNWSPFSMATVEEGNPANKLRVVGFYQYHDF